MLTSDELLRYDRQIIIRDFGPEGQEKLSRAKVFIAGAGGLGSPVAFYLAAAGVGHLRIVDNDEVSLGNLNRQILHWEENVGIAKVASAKEKLTRLNKNTKIETLNERITQDNASKLIGDSDLVVDATDNLEVRFLLNQVALKKNIPLLHGAVRGLEGRVTTIIPHKTACLKCMYRGTLPDDEFPVLGATPGVIGCIQAMEAIKCVVGLGELLAGRLVIFDGLKMEFKEFKTKRDPDCAHCGDLEKEGKQ